MRRVLIAWELGANYGHLASLLPIAQALRERYEVLFAVRDVRVAAEVLAETRFHFVPAPLPPARRNSPEHPPANYSEILLCEGYSDFLTLWGMVSAWLSIIRTWDVDLVLVDHAPTALLATWIADVQAIAVGNGFAVPPAIAPFPSIRPWEEIPVARLRLADEKLDVEASKVANAFGKARECSFRELFDKRSLLTTFWELEQFPVRSGGNYVGPIFSLPKSVRVNWLGSGKWKVLAYLRRGVPGFLNAIAMLKNSGSEVLARIPEISPNEARRLTSPNFRIAPGPIDLTHVLPEADLMVCYGSSGMIAESLLHGVPQLMMSQFVEQQLLALRVEAWGGGIAVGPDRTEAVLSASFQRILEDTGFKRSAQSFADRYRGYTPQIAIEKIVDAIEANLK